MTKDSITAVNRAIVMMLQGRIRFRMVSLLRSNCWWVAFAYCWWVYGWAPRRRLQLPLSEQTRSYAPPPKPEFSFRRPIIALLCRLKKKTDKRPRVFLAEGPRSEEHTSELQS